MEANEELSDRYYKALLPVTVILSLFIIVGVFGNGLIIIVFKNRRMYGNGNFRRFAICFGIIDILTSVVLIPFDMASDRMMFSFDSIFLCKTKCLVNNWVSSSAAFMLLIICVDRFRKVCQPLKKQMSPDLAVKLCVGISFVGCLILSIPAAVTCGIYQRNMTTTFGTNLTVVRCGLDDYYADHVIADVYPPILGLCLVGISVTCIVMYICIGCQIRKHWRALPERSPSMSSSMYSSRMHRTYRDTDSGSTKSASEKHSLHTVISNSITKESNTPEDSLLLEANRNKNNDSKTKEQEVRENGDRISLSSVNTDNNKGNTQDDANAKDELVNNARGNHNETEIQKDVTVPSLHQSEQTHGDAPLARENSHIECDRKNSAKFYSRFRRLGSRGSKRSQGSISSARTMSRQGSMFAVRRFPYKTLTWFILTVVFVVTHMLNLFLGLSLPPFETMSLNMFALFTGVSRLYFINSIVNAIVYALLDKKFRDVTKKIVKQCKSRFIKE